jgi:ATP-dependent DNA helicase RecQ
VSPEEHPDLQAVLRRWFGFPSFRPGQEEVIRAILDGRDVLALMPTGAGKSLCYQLPALLRSGLVLVISPLIALMKDQRDTFEQIAPGSTTTIDSTIGRRERTARIRRMIQGRYRLVFVAPERFRGREFISALDHCTISLLTIDETHCISEWGHDFRPAYRNIGHFRERMGMPQVLALTATATPHVQRDVIEQLKLRNPAVISISMDRPNLAFQVIHVADRCERDKRLLELLAELPGSGIVYTPTRQAAEQLAVHIRATGRSAGHYHAGLSSEERTRVQDAWMRGELEVLAATNAFGMGIDKPDVRFVIHATIPGSLEAYYQEAGRAGRDGEPARCCLFFSPKDQYRRSRLLLLEIPDFNEVERVYGALRLHRIGDYAMVDQSELIAETDLSPTKIEVSVKELERARIIARLPDGRRRAWLRRLATPDEVAPLIHGPDEPPWKTALWESLPQEAGEVSLEDLTRSLQVAPGEIEDLLWSLHYAGMIDLRTSSRAMTIQFSNRYLDRKWRRLRSGQLEELRKRKYRELEPMIRYATQKQCRRNMLLAHFGQETPEPCGICDVCQTRARLIPRSRGPAPDPETLAQGPCHKITRAIAASPNVLGKTKWALVFAGSSSRELRFTYATRGKAFGICKGVPQRNVRQTIDGLIQLGILAQTVEEYPTLHLGPRGQRFLQGELNPNEARAVAALDELVTPRSAAGRRRSARVKTARAPGRTSPKSAGTPAAPEEPGPDEDQIRRAILAAVRDFPSRFGIHGLARLLAGSSAKSLARSGFDRSIHYGTLEGLTQQQIRNAIEKLIQKGLLASSQGSYPVLRPTPEGAAQAKANPPAAGAPVPLRDIHGRVREPAPTPPPEEEPPPYDEEPPPPPEPPPYLDEAPLPPVPPVAHATAPPSPRPEGSPPAGRSSATSAKPGSRPAVSHDIAASGLYRLADPLFAPLVQAAARCLEQTNDEETLVRLLWILGESGDLALAPRIARFLHDPRRAVRLAAAQARELLRRQELPP